MCLLTVIPAGIAPDPVALQYGACANPHGHGFAIVTSTRIITGHGMDGGQSIDSFLRLRARHRSGPALFHSRYATHGIIGLGNCHPFPLGGDPRTVLAHNGTLPKRVRPGAYDWRSDTRIAAEAYLPEQPFGPLDTHRGFRGLESWLGRSKMAILTTDPAYTNRLYLLNEHLGVWDSGIWYSNASYLPPAQRWADWRTICAHCEDIDLTKATRFCRRCGWCRTCAFPERWCTCRKPTPPRLRLLPGSRVNT